MRTGECGVIVEKQLDADDRAMLRAMGLEASATIRVCRAGEPCIVAVIAGQSGLDGGGQASGPAAGRLDGSCCRIGLSRDLSNRIVVTVRGDPAGRAL